MSFFSIRNVTRNILVSLLLYLIHVLLLMDIFFYFSREATLAEMGVALKEDGGTIGVFSPKKVNLQTFFNF